MPDLNADRAFLYKHQNLFIENLHSNPHQQPERGQFTWSL